MEATWIFPSLAHLHQHPNYHALSRLSSITSLCISTCRHSLSLPKQVAYHAAIIAGRLLLVSPTMDTSVLIGVSILMACKAEECTRKSVDIAEAVSTTSNHRITSLDILNLETTALYRTGFNFTLDTPYRHLIRGMGNVEPNCAVTDEVLEEAVNRVEWALGSDVVFLFEPRVIGAAAVQCAASKCKADLITEPDWRCDPVQLADCVAMM